MFKFPDDFAPLTYWHLETFESGASEGDQPHTDLRYEDAQRFLAEDKRALEEPNCLLNDLRWSIAYGYPVDLEKRRYLHGVACRIAGTGRSFIEANDYHRSFVDRCWPPQDEKFRARLGISPVKLTTLRESMTHRLRDWASKLDEERLFSRDVARDESGPYGTYVVSGCRYLFFTSLQKARLIAACTPPSISTYDGHPVSQAH